MLECNLGGWDVGEQAHALQQMLGVKVVERLRCSVSVVVCPDDSVVHASGSGQLQANPHMACPWLSPGKPTRRAVATMGSNDLVVGEDHML